MTSMEILIYFIFNTIECDPPISMTGKMKGWLVNFPISLDIVHWPAIIRELKNHDDNQKLQCTAQAWPVNFVAVVSSTTPTKVESPRPAIHKLPQV